jgi:hypothetical protein
VASPGPVTTTATTTATATTPAATQPPAPSPGTLVSATASTDKTAYQPGETVKIELELKNMSGAPLALAKLPPIVSLMQAQTGQAVYTSPPGKEVRTLAPQEVARFNYAWNQTDFNGRPVTGSYYIELEDLEYQGQPIQLNQGTPPRFEILPGTDNETGTRNFSSPGIYNGVTDNGIEITSWNLRISDAGITVDIMNTPPPDYTVTPSGSGYRANKNYSAAAVYSLDGNWIQEAGMSSVTYAPAGMTHTWLLPVRVPPETAEIYFEITGIGGREGSWPVNMTLK